MRYRPLGASGIEASVVGLGTWAIGGWMWGGTDRRAAIRAIHAALDAGINLVDTAPVYGFGLSEEIVGEALRDRRDRAVIASKCGMVCNAPGGELKFASNALGPDPLGTLPIHVYLRPDSIRREVEMSLKRLATDCIDLMQPHWQEATTPIADTMGELVRLKEEGKIRAIGVCNAAVAHLEAYRQAGPLDSDQEKYSMLDRELEAEQMPYCRQHGVAMLAYSPLALGLLTGKIGPDREFAEGDLRRDHPRFSVENRRRVAAMLEKMQPVARDHGLTLGQLVIAWTVHQPGMTHALVGARNPQQAQENAAAGDAALSDEQLALMRQAIDEYERGG